jgi:hypothetical protein
LVKNAVSEATAVPVAFAITNEGSSGFRNLYVEMSMRSSAKGVHISEAIELDWQYTLPSTWQFTQQFRMPLDTIQDDVRQRLSQFDDEVRSLRQGHDSWSFAFEWSAMQPQRIRLIKPLVFVTTRQPATIEFNANVYADGFPQPVKLDATLRIDVEEQECKLADLMPEYAKLLERDVDFVPAKPIPVYVG